MDSRSQEQPKGTHEGPDRQVSATAGSGNRRSDAKGEKGSRAPRLVRVAAIALLLIALPFFVYFFTYARHQRAYHTQHHVRHLATAARELTAYIDQIHHLAQTVDRGTGTPDYRNLVQKEREARDYFERVSRLLDSRIERRDELNDERVRIREELASLSQRTHEYLRSLEADRLLWSDDEEEKARRPFEKTRRYLEERARQVDLQYLAIKASTQSFDDALQRWRNAQQELEGTKNTHKGAQEEESKAELERSPWKVPPYERMRVEFFGLDYVSDPFCEAGGPPGFRVDQLGAGSDADLEVVYTPCVPSTSQGQASYLIRATVPIEDLLRASVRGEDFSAVFVARADGRVLAQQTELPSKISQLGEILDLPESSAAALAPGDRTPPPPSERPSFEYLIGQPRLLIATIAGRRYRAYHEPVQLPLTPLLESSAATPRLSDGDAALQEKAGQWILVALVDDDEFRAESIALPLNILGLALFAVLIAVLSWPVLKLWLMSPREVFRRGDLAALSAAMALGAPLLVILLLDLAISYTSREKIDASLEAVAGKLRDGFSEELHQALGDLDEKAEQLGDLEQLANFEAGLPYPPDFEAVFWLDEEGRQMPRCVSGDKKYRWSRRADTDSRPLKLAGRGYFTHIRDRSAYPRKDGGGSFFAERILSRREGRKLTAISIPARAGANGSTKCSDLTSDGSRAVAVVLTRRMQTFHRTALPAGYGFAVVDDDSGEVLYHSDDGRSLFEDFFAEADYNRELLSAVHADRHLSTPLTYRGAPHRGFITPIEELPWTLIVFADESLLQTVNFDLGASVLIFVVLYGAGIVFTLLLVGAFGPRARWIMIWPQWRNERRYWLGIALILALFVLAVAALWKPVLRPAEGGLSGWWRVAFSIGVGAYIFSAFRIVFSASRPSWEAIRSFFSIQRAGWRIDALAAVVLLALGMWFLWISPLPGLAVVILTVALLLVRPASSAPQGPTSGFRFAYVSMWSLAFMMGSVLPAAVVFEDASRLQLDRLARDTRLSLARNISDKAADMREERRLFQGGTSDSLNGNDGGLVIGERKSGEEERNGAEAKRRYEGPLANDVLGSILFLAEEEGNQAVVGRGELEFPQSERKFEDEWTEVRLDHPTALFAALLPPYNRSAEETKQLYYEDATDGRWGRPASGESGALVYCTRPKDQDSCFTVTGAKLPLDLLPESRIALVVAALPVLVLALGLWLFMGALADRVLGLRIWNAVPIPRPGGKMPWSALLVGRSQHELAKLKESFKRRCEVRTVDLSDLASQDEKHQQWLEERGAPANTHPTAFFFEHLDDALRRPAARAALQAYLRVLIDEAAAEEERWVGLVSDADPERLLDDLRWRGGANGLTEREFREWLELLLHVKFAHRNCLLIRPPSDEISSIGRLIGKVDGAQLDLSAYCDRVGALRDDLSGKRLILIQNVEVALSYPALRAELLEQLEKLTGPDAGRAPPSLILLCASISPLVLLAQADAHPDLFSKGAPSGMEVLRWSELLSRFHTKRFGVKADERYETRVYVRDVLLCAKVFVLRLFGRADENSDPFSEWSPPGARVLRWSELLAGFRGKRFAVVGNDLYQTSLNGKDVLEREKEWWPDLAHAHAEMERELNQREGEFSADTMALRIADLGGAYYRHLWALSTQDERLMLLQLARGRLLNPRNAELVRQLLSRRLIRQMPDFQVATESFRQFVLQAESPETIARWEERASDSPWGSLRRPFLIGLVVAAALLLWSGGKPMAAMVSGVAVAVPALLQLLAALRAGQASPRS